MSNPGNIENKVEQALASIDGITRAKSNPFLYTRVMSSLKDNDRREWGVFNRPVIAFATVLLIILMNSLVFFQSSYSPPAAAQEDEQIFVKEYNYPQTTADRFYSENEEQP
jgi:hypothetical protein